MTKSRSGVRKRVEAVHNALIVTNADYDPVI